MISIRFSKGQFDENGDNLQNPIKQHRNQYNKDILCNRSNSYVFPEPSPISVSIYKVKQCTLQVRVHYWFEPEKI